MKKRNLLIDWIKAICVIFVIITHGDFCNDAMLDKDGLFYLLFVNKAVPVFMFLSGFVYAMGAKETSLKEQYSFERLKRKILRLTVPTLITYALFVVLKFCSGDALGFGEIVKRFFFCDYGSGSYYFAIMVEFVLVAPLMYYAVKNYAFKGVCLIGLINLAHELIWTMTDLRYGLYRILVLRYLLVAALGMYMARYMDRIKPYHALAACAAGLVHILLPYYTSYEYNVFTTAPWNLSAMGCAAYVFSLMWLIFRLFGKISYEGVIGKAIGKVGMASYHIMYTQMMYFVVRPEADKLIFDITTLPLWSQFAVDIVVCVGTGLVFCVVDNKIFGKFYKTK